MSQSYRVAMVHTDSTGYKSNVVSMVYATDATHALELAEQRHAEESAKPWGTTNKWEEYTVKAILPASIFYTLTDTLRATLYS